MNRFDVIALISGVLLTGVAVLALWLSLVGSVNWTAVRIAAPITLVLLGVAGLALSRNRS